MLHQTRQGNLVSQITQYELDGQS